MKMVVIILALFAAAFAQVLPAQVDDPLGRVNDWLKSQNARLKDGWALHEKTVGEMKVGDVVEFTKDDKLRYGLVNEMPEGKDYIIVDLTLIPTMTVLVGVKRSNIKAVFESVHTI